MKYEVLAGNRVRKMRDMKERSWDAYKQYIETLPIYPISGSHNWKEGQLIEEGRDFLFHDLMDGVTDDGNEYTFHRYAIQIEQKEIGVTVGPIPSLTGNEDELRARIKELEAQLEHAQSAAAMYQEQFEEALKEIRNFQ